MIAEEENNETTDDTAAEADVEQPSAQPEEPAAEEPAAEEPAEEEPTPAEEPAEAAPEDEAVEPAAPEEEPAPEPDAEGPAAEAAEPEEKLTPKQRRKRERSTFEGEASPQRSPGDRAAERAARRAAKAASRRRRRAHEREKREPGQGTPPAERRPGAKKVRQGTVLSSKADKTITVKIEVVRRHPVYEKVVRRSATVHAHDERNEASEGDVVRVIESRPLSRTKRWRLVEVMERAR